MPDETPTLIEMLEDEARNKRLLDLQFEVMLKVWGERIEALNGFTFPKTTD